MSGVCMDVIFQSTRQYWDGLLACCGAMLWTIVPVYTMIHSEEDFQRDIDLVVIPKEADGRIPRATQKIPAKLYVDVWPVLEDDIGIVIITRARDIVEVPQSHLEIIGK